MQSLCLEGYLCLLDLDVDQALGGRKLDRVLLERGLHGDRALQLHNKSRRQLIDVRGQYENDSTTTPYITTN